MKRAFRLIPRKFAAVTCLAALALGTLAPYATAGMWVQKEIKWHLTSVGTPTNPTGIYNRDTTYNVVAASQVDTTGEFSLSRADLFPNVHVGAATTVDTSLAGFLVFQGDSSVAVGSTISAMTYEVDGRAQATGASSGNTGWTQIDSVVVSTIPATGQVTDGPTSVCIIPLRAINALGGIGGSLLTGVNIMNEPYKIFACEDLRVRLTSVTGVLSACRVFVRYWDNDAQPSGSR